MLVSQIQVGFLSLLFKRFFGLKADEGPKGINHDYIQAVVEAGRRGEVDLLFEQGIQRFHIPVFVGAGAGFSGVQLISTFPGVIGHLVIERVVSLSATTISVRMAVSQGFGTAINGTVLDQRFADAVSGTASPPTTWNSGNGAGALAGVLMGRITSVWPERYLGWVTPLPILAAQPPPAFFTVWNETSATALSCDIYGYIVPEQA